MKANDNNIQDWNDFEIAEALIKEAINVTSLKNIEALSYLKKSLAIIQRLKVKYDNTYTVDQTAVYLGCSRKTVYRMIKDGKLKAKKDGRFYIVFESSIIKNKNKLLKKEKTMNINSLEALGLIRGGKNNG